MRDKINLTKNFKPLTRERETEIIEKFCPPEGCGKTVPEHVEAYWNDETITDVELVETLLNYGAELGSKDLKVIDITALANKFFGEPVTEVGNGQVH